MCPANNVFLTQNYIPLTLSFQIIFISFFSFTFPQNIHSADESKFLLYKFSIHTLPQKETDTAGETDAEINSGYGETWWR